MNFAIAKNKTFLTIAKDNTRLLACGYISASDYASFSSVKAKIGDAVYDVTYLPYTEEEVYNLERTGNKYDSYFKADLPDSVEVGDYVQFVFERTTANPVISVPNSAVIKYGTQYSVMLVRDGYMESREVTTRKLPPAFPKGMWYMWRRTSPATVSHTRPRHPPA